MNNFDIKATHEYDECIAKGMCSINPTLSSAHEVIMIILKELSYYMIKLAELGVNNQNVAKNIERALTSITCNCEYSQSEFQKIVSPLISDLGQAKKIYVDLCKRHNLNCQMIPANFKHLKKIVFSDLIKLGEKQVIKNKSELSEEQSQLLDIMLLLLKSICIKYHEYKSFDKDYEKACHAALSIMNSMNFPTRPIQEIKNDFMNFIAIYYELVRKVYWAQVEEYGEPKLTEVSTSHQEGKAILVSGYNLKELEYVLNATKGTDIKVYTYGVEMLVAHTFPKFAANKNLAGHWGEAGGNPMIDFANFPGPILMTKNALNKVEFLYRGRIFTTDILALGGVVKIKDKNFEPLIKSALSAKGFTKAISKTPLKVGFDEEEIMKKMNPVFDKLDSGEISDLFIFGLLNFCDNKFYFEKMYELIGENVFVLSLAYNKNDSNIYHINSLFEYSLLYKILMKLNERKPLKNYNISIFVSKCDKYTIANVLNLKNIGIKNVFLCKCPPTLINPSLMSAFGNIFGVHEFSLPHQDLAIIQNQKD